MIDDAKDFYVMDQEMADDGKDFYNLKDQEMIDYGSFLQPGIGYVDTKYVTLQCKITSVLNLHFISLN